MFIIRALETVRGDCPSAPTLVLVAGEIAEAERNSLGAVSAICSNGRRLGLKPGEYKILRDDEAEDILSPDDLVAAANMADAAATRIGSYRVDDLLALRGLAARFRKAAKAAGGDS